MQPLRHLTVFELANNNHAYPCLRLYGKWLAEAGFAPGSFVKVEVNKSRLIITPDPDREVCLLDREISKVQHRLNVLHERRASYG